jgi:hypothetical protein
MALHKTLFNFCTRKGLMSLPCFYSHLQQEIANRKRRTLDVFLDDIAAVGVAKQAKYGNRTAR